MRQTCRPEPKREGWEWKGGGPTGRFAATHAQNNAYPRATCLDTCFLCTAIFTTTHSINLTTNGRSFCCYCFAPRVELAARQRTPRTTQAKCDSAAQTRPLLSQASKNDGPFVKKCVQCCTNRRWRCQLQLAAVLPLLAVLLPVPLPVLLPRPVALQNHLQRC